ncbi:hypothetical protein GOP47_0023304 [Adiantum capillus-veneris]|uniref:NAB domain-containing protein n=1 Tax=Adiantum capillus-veneris TaxID=13818 RepID=A0A9D4U8N7_ADICA|nr:hypothetical protein GOP47_0022940 [Adiantum capillus-veneris]KAI5062765.1 hypothetical protein GOP47_0023304 [Adiantum capillus-veneris]
MLKLERSPSHSWWWDSHNSPKHSKWLQSNLQDLDDKVKEMLRLIEEDADSFAQRAEMYYQKRPELVNLVEEFYRAYRSLAERYDHLTGEIRQNIPRALQVQYGLSCDSPRSTGANGVRHHYSPLRRSNQLFETLLKKACQIDEPAKEAGNNSTQALCDQSTKDLDNTEQHGCTDVSVESHPNSSDEGGLSSSSSDSEVDNLTPLNRLRAEINELEEMNKALAESHEKTLELNTALESKVKDLEESFKAKEEEVKEMNCKLLELNAELVCLSAVSSQQHEESHINESYAPQKELEIEILPSLEDGSDSSAGEEDTRDELFKSSPLNTCEHACDFSVESAHEERTVLVSSLQDEVGILREENRKQELIIFDREEEKREVIRQLSVSLEMVKSENHRLEAVIGLLKKRLQGHNATAAACGVSHSPFAAWRQLFSVGFKVRQPFVAVAL